MYEEGFVRVYTGPSIYIEILSLLLSSLMLGMLYDLSHILYNPFGRRPLDLPHVAVGGGIRKMARSFASGDYLPPTMESPDLMEEENSKMVMSYDSTDDEEQETDDESSTSEDSFFDDYDASQRINDDYVVNLTRDRLCSGGRGSIFAGITKKLPGRSSKKTSGAFAFKKAVLQVQTKTESKATFQNAVRQLTAEKKSKQAFQDLIHQVQTDSKKKSKLTFKDAAKRLQANKKATTPTFHDVVKQAQTDQTEKDVTDYSVRFDV